MAELNIKERQAGDVTVLEMDGKITIGEGSVALRTAVRRLGEEGRKKILFNLGGVGYLDSSGIGTLVQAVTEEYCTKCNKLCGQGSICSACNRATGSPLSVKLINLTNKIQDLLAITKLLTVFDVYESESDALRSFE